MIQFIKTVKENDEYDHSDITMTIKHNDIDLNTILEEFETFLRAIGYVFDGVVDIVNEKETDENKQDKYDSVFDIIKE